YVPGIEPPKPQNLSLMATLARYLETYPPGHPLHVEHPWFRQFAALDATTAYLVVRGLLVLAGVGLLWWWRRPWRSETIAFDLPRQWAAVCALVTLVAPQCWKQHLVMLLPAGFLVLHDALQAPTRPWGRCACLAFTAFVMLLQQDIMGRATYIVVVSYKLDTFAALGMLATMLAGRGRSGQAVRQQPSPCQTAAIAEADRRAA
ncbi:MAG: hypothetical protein NZO58_12600, partial [Gemmataceae bacterium]|nr:hypothetical protein [Gemmataceae bacterium]